MKPYVLLVRSFWHVLALSIAILANDPASAQGCEGDNVFRLEYTGINDLEAFQLNGAAATLNPNQDGVLRLTNDLSQSASAFSLNSIPLTIDDTFLASFSTVFSFEFSDSQGISDNDGQGADGIVFVLQTVANNVGGGGAGIGYQGINNSLGIEFDTYNNGSQDQGSGNHIGVNFNGGINSTVVHPIPGRMNDGQRYFAWIDYNGDMQILEVRLSNDSVRPTDPTVTVADLNLPQTLGAEDAYVGFTSGTGLASNEHDIHNFQFINRYAPNGVCNNRSPQITSQPKTVHILQPVVGEPELIDLTTWQVIEYDVGDSSADWVIGETGLTVTQRNNANPSIFLSDFNLNNGQTRGRFRTATTSDDDFLGFAFGYKDRTNFYLFDWKQRNQGTALEGMRVKRFSGSGTPDFWASNPGGESEVLYSNSLSYQDLVQYEFELDFFPGEFEIKVTRVDTNELIDQFVVQDDTFLDGGFGFYNYSQGPVEYQGFDLGFTSSREYVYAVQAVDPDGNALTYSLLDGPVDMVIDPKTGVIRWITTSEDIGVHAVSIEVRDGNGGSDRQDYQLEVTASVPVISTTPITDAHIGRLYVYDVDADDPTPNEVLTFTLESAPSGMIIDSQTGHISWVPTDDDQGSASVTLRVEDRIGGFDIQSFDISVSGPSGQQSPEITSLPPSQAQVGFEYRYGVVATDPEGDELTYGLAVAPIGMAIDSQSGLIEWTPTQDQVGATDVQVRVWDAEDASSVDTGYAVQSFSIEVLAADTNQAPVITSSAQTFALSGSSYEYQIQASDPDGEQLLYMLLDGPSGMTVSDTGLVNWLAQDTLGIQIRVRVSDGVAYSDQVWTLGVSDGNVKALLDIQPQVARQGEMVVITVSAAPIPDPATLSLLIDGLPVSLNAHGVAQLTGLAADEYLATATVTSGNDSNTITLPFVVEDTDTPGSEIAFNVRNLEAEAQGNTINLSWSPPSFNTETITAYDIYLDEQLVASVSGSPFMLENLAPQSVFQVRLVSQNTFGNSSSGTELTIASTFPNPTDTAALARDGAALLTWSGLQPQSGLASYRVYISDTSFTDIVGKVPVQSVPASQTSTIVPGLSNGQEYYVAVTAVTISGSESVDVMPISVRPNMDVQPPEIDLVLLGGQNLIDQQIVDKSSQLCVRVTDNWAVEFVEFFLNGTSFAVSGEAQDQIYCAELNLDSLDNGQFILRFLAFDTSGNENEVSRTINIQLALPEPPTIVSPVDQTRTGDSNITVTGNTMPGLEVQLIVNGVAGEWFNSDTTGQFQSQVYLSQEGQNSLQARARSRAGQSELSSPVAIELDTSLPAQPIGVIATPQSQGRIQLEWSPGTGANVVGYHLYRSQQAFDILAEAELLSSDAIIGTEYSDLLLDDGQYYYRVVAVNDLGAQSEPSRLVNAFADMTAPRALNIHYSSDGPMDPGSNTFGRGLLNVVVEVSEPLLTTPFLSITPDGGVPINVALSRDNDVETIYNGSLLLDEFAGSGTAYAVFSARDKLGNRGTEVDSGSQIQIDTLGPEVLSVAVEPASPIENDQSDPVTVTATFQLSEPVASAATFDLSYSLSGDNRTATLINNIAQISATEWQAAFTLPADAGLASPEELQFSFTTKDELQNPGSKFRSPFKAQVYQGQLPPFESPFAFRANAIAQGQIELRWSEVESASSYQLYRQAPGETELSAYQRLDPSERFVDDTTIDGIYQYQISSIRSANGIEAESVRSEIASATSDSVSPEPPTNIRLELTSVGVQIAWDATPEPDQVFRIYRAASEPLDLIALTPIIADVNTLQALDGDATQAEPIYAVTAVDASGNESVLSETVYLNVALLPVASLKVELRPEQKPLISWTHSSTDITDFDVYLGEDQTGTKLNNEVIRATQFSDLGYTGASRTYAVVARDANNEQSLPRSITMPNVTVQRQDDAPLLRNSINAVKFAVENKSEFLYENARLRILTAQGSYQSPAFSLPSLSERALAVNVAGIAQLPDEVDAEIVLELSNNNGEQIHLYHETKLEVINASLGLDIVTDGFARGTDGQVQFTLRNTGAESLELITALNNGSSNSPDVVFTLSDLDGNVLAISPFRQVFGPGVITKVNGETIATIGSSDEWTSEPVAISVPENAPDSVSLQININHLYSDRSSSEQISIRGPQRRQTISLGDTPYFGEIQSVTPQTSFGDEPILIEGGAVSRETGLALGNVDIKVVIANLGFEREFDVTTNEDGKFSFTFEPQSTEAGRYLVSALHPTMSIRPVHAEFVIGRLILSPDRVFLRLPQRLNYELPITLQSGDGANLSNLRFVAEPADQPSGQVPPGITLNYPQVDLVVPDAPTEASIQILASQDADAAGQVVISVYSDQSPNQALGKIRLRYELTEALPAISHTPSILELGTTLIGSTSGTISLENRGSVSLVDARLEIKTDAGFPGPEWLTITTPSDIGELAVGDTISVDIAMSPNNSAPVGVEQYFLELTSANDEPYKMPIYTVVSEAGEGGVLFQVTDMYTGTLDSRGRVIQGLSGASIRLENEQIPGLHYDLVSDEVGEVLIQNVPAGRYSAWISSPNYQEEHRRLRIQPGLVASEQVFLDYNLIRLDWSVREVTIEDRYQIVLNATFETDVPAAVVMLEPTNLTIPNMQVGDVFYGELTLTNYGLIRAFDVEFTAPRSDQYYQFEFLNSAIPDSLEAKEVVVIPYKITALNPLNSEDGGVNVIFPPPSPDDPPPTAPGGIGCGDYVRCADVHSLSRCPTGISGASSKSCLVKSFGRCSGSGGELFLDGSYGSGSGELNSITPRGLPACRGDGDCGTGNGPGGG